MMPQQLATTVADGDPVSSRILVVVDESDHPVRALRYVGTLLCDTRDVHVTRFHILKPMPREILEYGDSKAEACLADNLKKGQEDWTKSESPVEYPIVVQALEVFGRTGFLLDRVTQFATSRPNWSASARSRRPHLI